MGETWHLRLGLFAIGCLVVAPACFKDLTIEEACEGGDCSNARGGAQGAGGMNGERVPLDGAGLIIQCSVDDQNAFRPDRGEVRHVEWNTATGQRDIIWVYRRDDYCHWLDFCPNAMPNDQECAAHEDIVNDPNLEQLNARQQMATNLSMCKANNCMDSIAPAQCLLTNCSEQLAACEYVQPVGRVKWFKFGPPVGLSENTAQWEIEVRSAVDGVAGRPWIFVYTWSDDCEGPLQLQGELQTTNAGECGEDPEDPEDPDIPRLSGTRISLSHPGHFIVGVGDGVNDANAAGKQFLLRATHSSADSQLQECPVASDCGFMSSLCGDFGCSLLSAEPEPIDAYPAFQCMQ
jgi:hypothetical protein